MDGVFRAKQQEANWEAAEVNQLRRMHMEHFNQETRMKSFLTQKCVSVDVWCRVQRFCRLRIVLDKKSLKEAAARTVRMAAVVSSVGISSWVCGFRFGHGNRGRSFIF